MSHHHKQTHSHRQRTHTHTHTHTHWRNHNHAHRYMCKKPWIRSAEEFLELYGKVEALVRICLLRWSGPCLRYLVPTFSISVFALNILPFFRIRLEHFSAGTLLFFTTPKILRAEVRYIWTLVSQQRIKVLKNEKRFFLISGLIYVPQRFQTSAMNRKYRSGQADNLWFW